MAWFNWGHIFTLTVNSLEDSLDHLSGYTAVVNISKRMPARRHLSKMQPKSRPKPKLAFCPIGFCSVIKDEIDNPGKMGGTSTLALPACSVE